MIIRGYRNALVRNKNGKHAGIKNQARWINILEADRINGGGITTLLLQSVSKSKLQRLKSKYRVARVEERENHFHAARRVAVKDDEYMAGLAVLYGEQSSPRGKSAVVREFSKWIVGELNNSSSDASKWTEVCYYKDVGLEKLGSGWWARQIAQRRKKP